VKDYIEKSIYVLDLERFFPLGIMQRVKGHLSPGMVAVAFFLVITKKPPRPLSI